MWLNFNLKGAHDKEKVKNPWIESKTENNIEIFKKGYAHATLQVMNNYITSNNKLR